MRQNEIEDRLGPQSSRTQGTLSALYVIMVFLDFDCPSFLGPLRSEFSGFWTETGSTFPGSTLKERLTFSMDYSLPNDIA